MSEIDSEEVERLYWEEEMSQREIAERFDTDHNQIGKIMRKHDISTRSKAESTHVVKRRKRKAFLEEKGITPEKVKKMYWEDNLSQNEIAEHFGVNRTVIRRVMYRNDIERREKCHSFSLPNEKIEAPPDKLGYIAGLLDGEGWIGLRKEEDRSTYSPNMGITNTERECLELCKETCGLGEIYSQNGRKINHSTNYGWKIFRMPSIWVLLRSFKPYLVIKEPHAELMLDFIKLRRRAIDNKEDTQNKEEEIYRKMKELNKRGTSKKNL